MGPHSSPLISSAFALWANAELYILGPSLPFFLPFFLSFFLSPSLSEKGREKGRKKERKEERKEVKDPRCRAPPLPFGQMRSSTSWVLHFLSFFLSFSLPFSRRKLEKSLNFDATTLKFCMRHPWTQSFRFRENQIVCMSLSLLVGSLPY